MLVISAMAGHYVYLKTTGAEGVRCEVMVYPLEVGATASKWKEKGKRRRKWFAPEKAAEAVAEPELGELIRSFASAVERSA